MNVIVYLNLLHVGGQPAQNGRCHRGHGRLATFAVVVIVLAVVGPVKYIIYMVSIKFDMPILLKSYSFIIDFLLFNVLVTKFKSCGTLKQLY